MVDQFSVSRRTFLASSAAASVLAAVGASAVAARAADEPKAAGDTNNDWPLARGDALSTGVARSELAADLKLDWKFSVKDGAFLAPAIIAGGVVFVGDADGMFYAFNLDDGSIKWKHKADESSYSGGAAFRDGKVYVGDLNGDCRCYDARSGDVVWKYSTGTEEEPGGEISSSPNFYKNLVLFGSRDAKLYAIDTTNGKLAWKYEIGDQIRCSPTVIGNRTFVAGCDAKLHIVDVDKGTAVTTVDIKTQTGSTPAAIGDVVYFGSGNGSFFAVNWKTAKIEWTFRDERSEQEIESSAAASPEGIYYGSQDKKLHALDLKGNRLWAFSTRGAVDSSPVVSGDRVYVGSADGRVYGVTRKTGKEAWKYEAGGRFKASPAIAAEKLVIGNENGTLYCFGAK